MELLSPFAHITLVDDKKAEIKHILEIFQEKNVPYTYYNYDGTPESLPVKPSESIRILFMDLYLLEDGTVEQEASNVSGKFMTVLSTIVKPKTPYILVIWSKHIVDEEKGMIPDQGYTSVVERLNKDEDLTPLAVIPLDKKNYLESSASGELGTLLGTVDALETAITENVQNNISAKTLLHWNNLVGSSTNATLGNLREIFASKGFDSNFFERLMFEFARAYLGKNMKDSVDKYKSSFHFITDLFKDNLEEKVNLLDSNAILDFKKNDINPPTENDFALINSKILFSNNKPNIVTPGNVYKVESENFSFYHSGFYSDIFDIRKKKDSIIGEDKTLSNNRASSEAKEFFKKKFDLCVPITVNLTPVCDYAQKKYVYHKYCQGILLPNTLKVDDYLKLGAAYHYLSPPFSFDDGIYKLVLDLRLINHDLCDPPEEDNYLFRIREQPLLDIQHKLSNHIGRPGVVFMDKNLL